MQETSLDRLIAQEEPGLLQSLLILQKEINTLQPDAFKKELRALQQAVQEQQAGVGMQSDVNKKSDVNKIIGACHGFAGCVLSYLEYISAVGVESMLSQYPQAEPGLTHLQDADRMFTHVLNEYLEVLEAKARKYTESSSHVSFDSLPQFHDGLSSFRILMSDPELEEYLAAAARFRERGEGGQASCKTLNTATLQSYVTCFIDENPAAKAIAGLAAKLHVLQWTDPSLLGNSAQQSGRAENAAAGHARYLKELKKIDGTLEKIGAGIRSRMKRQEKKTVHAENPELLITLYAIYLYQEMKKDIKTQGNAENIMQRLAQDHEALLSHQAELPEDIKGLKQADAFLNKILIDYARFPQNPYPELCDPAGLFQKNLDACALLKKNVTQAYSALYQRLSAGMRNGSYPLYALLGDPKKSGDPQKNPQMNSLFPGTIREVKQQLQKEQERFSGEYNAVCSLHLINPSYGVDDAKLMKDRLGALVATVNTLAQHVSAYKKTGSELAKRGEELLAKNFLFISPKDAEQLLAYCSEAHARPETEGLHPLLKTLVMQPYRELTTSHASYMKGILDSLSKNRTLLLDEAHTLAGKAQHALASSELSPALSRLHSILTILACYRTVFLASEGQAKNRTSEYSTPNYSTSKGRKSIGEEIGDERGDTT
ncbi:MAG: hypothetical protein V1743_00245 [Nanoarchaeota archaeon]